MNRDASPQQSQRAADAQPLRVGYLVNQYPAISHTFIRREIAALERHNVTVQRYSIRPSDAGGNAFPDPRDEREQQITRSILSGGLKSLAVALLREAASNTRRMSRALALTWRVWRKSKLSLPLHLAYLAEACVLHRWTAEENLDHVHAHFATNSATVAMFCQELGGPPYSFTVHGPEEFDRAVILAMDDKIARSAFVVAITHYCRSQLMRWCALEHWDKLKLIRCGLAEDFLEAQPQPIPERRRLISVGRLCEQKAPLVLVEAAGRLAADGLDFELVLIGGGELRAVVERRIAELHLNDHVKLTGWASNAIIPQAICDARALVLPSFAEGLPAVMMEAFALGRPVITTYIAGHPELVQPGANGWLVPAGSVDELAQAMREALEAPVERLEQMGQSGRERVRRLHDARQSTAQLAVEIRESLNHRSPSPTRLGATPGGSREAPPATAEVSR